MARGNWIDGQAAVYSPDWTALPVTVAISGTTAKPAAALALGVYRVQANVACFFRVGAFSSIVATTSCHPLEAGQEVLFQVTATGSDDGIAAITGGVSGTLYISKVHV